jgi:DNA (cytosine-5)-methyltransferase 1
MQRMRAVDLFCGTGGFSRGAHAAGFDVVAAYDLDPNLTFSYPLNFPETTLRLTDIAQLTGEAIRADAGNEHIDLIFGGPPCQGFSSIGRRDRTDPRRTLLEHFFRLVSEVRPSAFVMENVEGLLFSDAIHELEKATVHAAGYHLLKTRVLNAADFGAATNRRRAFVIGYDPDLCAPLDWTHFAVAEKPAATVRDAIADLKSPVALGEDSQGFDLWRLRRRRNRTAYAERHRSDDQRFTGNKRTKHLPHVIERFDNLPQGGFDPIGKYPRLAWNGRCPTLRAGTGADKGSHQSIRPIHPNEPRVITVREAARLQGFPDEHRFHPTIWHSFRQIGNSVSPIIAQAVLTVICRKLEEGPLAQAAE